MTDQQHIETLINDALDKWDDSDDDSSATDAILAALDEAGLRIVPNAVVEALRKIAQPELDSFAYVRKNQGGLMGIRRNALAALATLEDVKP